MNKFRAGHLTMSLPVLNRRQFLFGALAAGTLGLTACGEQQAVQVTTTSTPTPTAPPSAAPMPSLPPLPPKTYPADLKNALIAMDEMVSHYAKVFDTPSTLIHAVRGFGRNFQRADGSNAVAHLCERYVEEKLVNGKPFLRFTRYNVEVHDNSFLKTFIEAGVSLDHPVTCNGKKYTLRDVSEHAKALFRLDPSNLDKYEKEFSHEHLPWSLIAFTNLMPGGKGSWENAYGEKIDLMEVIDKGLNELETACRPLQEDVQKGESVSNASHEVIKGYSCYAGHSVYAFLSSLKNGYTDRNLKERISDVMKQSLFRLAKEGDNIEKEYESAKGGPISPNPQEEAMYDQQLQRVGLKKDDVIEMLKLRGHIKLTGHILEATNFARLNNLFTPTPEQQKQIQSGEQKLFASIVQLRALNLEGLRQFNAKQANDNIVALGHASRALKLLTPDNPDKNPKAI
ncbi:MAG TPA: hypothetical protein VFZ34_29720 [Blastocatellia bacterium]|nr:hypothetical protein [Blastocatellia bacterium]